MIRLQFKKGNKKTVLHIPDKIDIQLITDDRPISVVCNELGITPTAGYSRIKKVADRLKIHLDKNSVPPNMYYPVLKQLILVHPVFWDMVFLNQTLEQSFDGGENNDKL